MLKHQRVRAAFDDTFNVHCVYICKNEKKSLELVLVHRWFEIDEWIKDPANVLMPHGLKTQIITRGIARIS